MKNDTGTGYRPARCRPDSRREAILSVARKVFSEEGFAAASMSHIAAEVGGSKGTLYHYFRNKQALFEAHIEDRCHRFTEAILNPPLPEGEIVESLLAVAERGLGLALSDETAVFYKLVVSEAERNPSVGRAFYESGPRITLRHVAELLERAQSKGQIVAGDCSRAAEDFLSLTHGHLHMQRILRVIPPPSAAEIRAEAKRIVETFMHAYGPRDRSLPTPPVQKPENADTSLA